MRKINLLPVLIIAICPLFLNAQDANTLVQKVKAKLDKVSDYEASGKMKTNVTFLKVPIANIKLYYKKPDKVKIKNEKGFSFIPKGAVNINMSNSLNNGKYSVLDAGIDKIDGVVVRVVKLLPDDDNADVVLSTLYIDETNLVIRKSKTTTRENGSYELQMSYGKYADYGLPDKIIFSFNTKDYKLPKGVSFDFEDGSEAKNVADKTKNKKGRAEITFTSYNINKGVADTIFL
jgi:outer membrane lipoprotein-sorting protein